MPGGGVFCVCVCVCVFVCMMCCFCNGKFGDTRMSNKNDTVILAVSHTKGSGL